MPRFAMVVVVEADSLDRAWEVASGDVDEDSMMFVGNPWPVEEVDEYSTDECIDARGDEA
jgi:hypothetical protein